MKTLLIIATAFAAMGAVGWLANRFGPRVSDLILRRVVLEVAP